MKTKLAIFVVLIVAVFVLYQNCGNEQNAFMEDPFASADQRQISAELETSRDEILKTAVMSCSASTECEALPTGAKPCGGPSGYLIVSTKQTDMHRLNELIAAFTQSENRLNASLNSDGSGLVGNCMHLMPPNIDCIENVCQAVPD